MDQYDAIIIGFGKGGKTLAGKLGGMGKKVAVIEKSEKMYGGTCINVGCIPSKSLVHSAAFSSAFEADDFDAKAVRYAAAIEEKRKLVDMLRRKNYEKLANNPNIIVINAAAQFLEPHVVEIVNKTEIKTISAPQIFINTGSVPMMPEIEGLADNPRVYTSESLMEKDDLPKRLTIIGGGYIGLEFASMYASFGSIVTILQDGEVFLPREDQDIADEIRNLLEKQQISIYTGVKITKAGSDGSVIYEKAGDEKALAGDAILVATGRRPNIDGLNLDAAGVETTVRGAIAVNENLQTRQPGIWALGDVIGGQQFTYTSLDDYRIVISQLAGKADYSLEKRKNVPYSVFMRTPFSRVGLNEKEAEKAGIAYKVIKMPAAVIPKAQVLRQPEGLLKALINPENGKIIGMMLLCAESYEVINLIKLAMDLDADFHFLRDQIYTHPTMSEGLNDFFSLA